MERACRLAWAPLLLLSACGGSGSTGTPSGTHAGTTVGSGTGLGTGTGTGTGTGGTTPPGTCPSVHDRVEAVACASTTATVVSPTTTSYASWSARLDATVVAVPPVTSSLPAAPSLEPCDGVEVPAAQTVELLDQDGETWVLGWEVEDPDGVAAALASLTPGQPVTLAASTVYWGLSGGGYGVALHDAAGPLVAVDRSALPAPGRGFDVDVRSNVCRSVEPGGGETWDEHELTFTTPVDDLVLFGGQRGALDHPGRTLDVAVDLAGWPAGCLDGCGFNGWAVWAASP